MVDKLILAMFCHRQHGRCHVLDSDSQTHTHNSDFISAITTRRVVIVKLTIVILRVVMITVVTVFL